MGARRTGHRPDSRGRDRPRARRSRARCARAPPSCCASSGPTAASSAHAGAGPARLPAEHATPSRSASATASRSRRLRASAGSGVPTGEFILGYPNHYDVIPPSPVVPAALDPQRMLPSLENPYHALGRAGAISAATDRSWSIASCSSTSPAFWRALRDETVRRRGAADAGYMIWLASKMVGRWPSGAPLVDGAARRRPDARDERRVRVRRRSGWPRVPDRRARPAHAIRATISSRIRPSSRATCRRRTGSCDARASSARRCSTRRSRGRRRSGDRDAVLSLEDDGQARGIHFFCVNASIRSQFEFVQQTWCNNPSFGGLSANKDPIVGDHARAGDPPTRMVIPEASSLIRTAACRASSPSAAAPISSCPASRHCVFWQWARSPDAR